MVSGCENDVQSKNECMMLDNLLLLGVERGRAAPPPFIDTLYAHGSRTIDKGSFTKLYNFNGAHKARAEKNKITVYFRTLLLTRFDQEKQLVVPTKQIFEFNKSSGNFSWSPKMSQNRIDGNHKSLIIKKSIFNNYSLSNNH